MEWLGPHQLLQQIKRLRQPAVEDLNLKRRVVQRSFVAGDGRTVLPLLYYIIYTRRPVRLCALRQAAANFL